MGNGTPKKVLRKRNKNQAKTIQFYREENDRLTAENNRNAEMVAWLWPLINKTGMGAVVAEAFPDVLERAIGNTQE